MGLDHARILHLYPVSFNACWVLFDGLSFHLEAVLWVLGVFHFESWPEILLDRYFCKGLHLPDLLFHPNIQPCELVP